MDRSEFGKAVRKTAAVILCMAMAFGAASVLPDDVIKNNAVVASAKDRTKYNSVEANGCVFYFSFTERTGKTTIAIEDAEILNADGTLDIPPRIKYENINYTVTDIEKDFLERDTTVRNVIIPDTVTNIGHYCLLGSSVESLTLSDNLEKVGTSFCGSCPELKYENVVYNGTKLSNATSTIFTNSPGMVNENGAVCLGSWLIKYIPEPSASSVRIADLSVGDVKIDRIADNAINSVSRLFVVDLEGVEYIGSYNFRSCPNLTTILNDDEVSEIGSSVLSSTKWMTAAKNNGLVRIGKVLFYYKTDSAVIDLTSGELEGVKDIRKGAFVDCRNADTIICTSDQVFSEDIFYKAYDNIDQVRDLLPLRSTYKIRDIYLDNKKLVFSKSDPLMNDWAKKHCELLKGTEWKKIQAEEKTKALFEQLDITYYGLDNDMIGKLSPTQEFYNTLKIHEYLSTFDYDYEYHCTMDAFLNNGTANCLGYATLANYLLQCSGVRSIHISSESDGSHAWNQTMISDEWFESDMGWDEQLGHNYDWFTLSTDNVLAKDIANDGSKAHKHVIPIYTWYYDRKNRMDDYTEAKRTLGDINGDGVRDDKDAWLLWDLLKGNISADRVNEKLADINFDGTVDITDGVLLENFIWGTSVDPENYPTDSLSPGFNVVFADANEPEDIDPTEFVYMTTDSDGYIVLPEIMFEAPEDKKFGGWDHGRVGQRVKISDPYTVIQPIWRNESDPEGLLGDVDGSGTIDISDVSKIINHINGVKALDEEEFLRADVNKSNTVEISDASAIVNHINGIKAVEGTL